MIIKLTPAQLKCYERNKEEYKAKLPAESLYRDVYDDCFGSCIEEIKELDLRPKLLALLIKNNLKG